MILRFWNTQISMDALVNSIFVLVDSVIDKLANSCCLLLRIRKGDSYSRISLRQT